MRTPIGYLWDRSRNNATAERLKGGIYMSISYTDHTDYWQSVPWAGETIKRAGCGPVYPILFPDTWRVTLPQFSAMIKWLPSDMKSRLTLYGIPCTIVSPIKKVIFNDPATIVFWEDGDKTIVKCQDGDEYSKETGLAMCIAKKALGNKGNFNDVFKEWIPEYGKGKEPKQEQPHPEDPKELIWIMEHDASVRGIYNWLHSMIDKAKRQLRPGDTDGLEKILAWKKASDELFKTYILAAEKE